MLSNFDLNNLVTYRGDDMLISLTFKDSNGVAIDITGWTIFFTIKKTKDDTDAASVYEQDITTIPNPTLGVLQFTIPHTVTQTLTGSYWYDIQVKKLDGTIQTVTNGNINFERDVTRRTTPAA